MVKRLPWSKLHQEAHNLEHAISAEAEASVFEELGHPKTCPHGNPLPGFEEAVANWTPLTKTSPKDKVIIKRIHEIAEQNSELMAFLETKGILLGVHAKVLEMLPFNQTITIEVKGQQITLGFASAKFIFVEPAH